MTVKRFTLTGLPLQRFLMPVGSKLLYIHVESGSIFLWALIDDSIGVVNIQRRVAMYLSLASITNRKHFFGTYLGTAVVGGNEMHFFDDGDDL